MKLALLGLCVTLGVLGAACSDEGNVFSLGVGDCFTSLEESEIADVPLVDCSEPHQHEVYAIWNLGDTLPSRDAMDEGCVGLFEDAIGTPYADSEIFTAALTPTADSFEAGDREVVCYTFEFDDAGELADVTGSVLNSGR